MLVLYFSGTGNSAYMARRFAERMEADCHSIEEEIDFDNLLAKTDTAAVCYPIYGSCVPRIMREFAEKHREAFADKKLIIFCTQMMFSGDGAKAFARLLPECDKNVIYAEHFNMPNNICNFFLFPIRDREKVRKVRAADKKLDRVCCDIKNGVIKRRGWGVVPLLLGKLQNTYAPRIEEKGKSSFQVNQDCIRCGLCVECCPMHNLELSADGVVQKNNCTLCYRCVNLCPKKAATVMRHEKVRRQYKRLA